MKLKQWTTTSLAMIGMLQAFVPQKAQAQSVNRPPQYVLLAFDGSYNNDVWQSSREYSHQKSLQGVDVRFTYFINPVYLLAKCPANAANCTPPSYTRSDWYNPPGYRLENKNGAPVQVKNVGSAIGWGDSSKDIAVRLEHMNEATSEGHEIGSHAVGHFDGTAWSYADWKSEFTQFYNILDNVFTLNKIPHSVKHPEGLNFRNTIVGFRAPVLGFSQGMYQALPEFGIKYDTTQQNKPAYWPTQKLGGVWDFPLASITRPGTGRTLPSMDYNFCYSDTKTLLQTDPGLKNYAPPGGKANTNTECLTSVRPEQKVQVKNTMMTMYMNYFNNNYYGNRAPVSIGHHFSKWMSGAYYETFFEFADKVCSLPEVRCVTYRELMEFMQSTPSSVVEAYKQGAFAKLPRPKSSIPARPLDLQAKVVLAGNELVLETSGRDALLNGLRKSIYVGTNKIEGDHVKMADIYKLAPNGEISIRGSVVNKLGEEVQSSTHQLTGIGTSLEKFDIVSAEEKASKGHMIEAHAHDADFDQTNSDTFGH